MTIPYNILTTNISEIHRLGHLFYNCYGYKDNLAATSRTLGAQESPRRLKLIAQLPAAVGLRYGFNVMPNTAVKHENVS
jgi:hypothetical protein